MYALSDKNQLGMTQRVTTIGIVRVSFLRSVFCLAITGGNRVDAADDITNYSAHPALGEVALGSHRGEPGRQQRSLPSQRRKSGLGGLPQNSRWHQRVDEAVVPERSARVQIVLVCGGTPRTSGISAVRRLRLTAPTAAGVTERAAMLVFARAQESVGGRPGACRTHDRYGNS